MTSALYIKSLEDKIRELREIMQNDSRRSESLHDQQPPSVSIGRSERHSDQSPSLSVQSPPESFNEDVIETMVGTHDNVHDKETSPQQYRGSFAGLRLLQRVQGLCRQISGLPRSSNTEALEERFVRAFDLTPTNTSCEGILLLPQPAEMTRAIDVVLNQALSNMQFLDCPSLQSIVADIYSDVENVSLKCHGKSLAFLYSVLALARLSETVAFNEDIGSRQGAANGLRYFNASREMIDPASCRDLVSLQTLLCIAIYAQASSMMSTSYSYICIAVSTALQMGLFEDEAPRGITESEKLCRRQIFAVLNIMDTYVTVALGLPKTLRNVISDQALPAPVKPLTISEPLAGTYAHAQLIQILAAAVESIHPPTRPISEKNGFYAVEYSKITAIERQLEAWFVQLPPLPSTSEPAIDSNVTRSQLLLRLSYAHVQMVLYKPFLHHTLKGVLQNCCLNLKAYACGSACIKAAMQVVWLAERLETCKLFNESYWFTTLILAFAASCLAVFVLSNSRDESDETAIAVCKIRELCSRHADGNVSMQRCSEFLESLPLGRADVRDLTHSNMPSRYMQNIPINFGELYDGPQAGDEQDSTVLQALSLPMYLHSSDHFGGFDAF